MKRLKAESKIRKYTLLEMLFADDAAVCAHSEEELQEIMQIFYQTFQEFGLQLALKKTEVMIILGAGPLRVRVRVQDPHFLGGPGPSGPGPGLLPRPEEDPKHC